MKKISVREGRVFLPTNLKSILIVFCFFVLSAQAAPLKISALSTNYLEAYQNFEQKNPLRALELLGSNLKTNWRKEKGITFEKVLSYYLRGLIYFRMGHMREAFEQWTAYLFLMKKLPVDEHNYLKIQLKEFDYFFAQTAFALKKYKAAKTFFERALVNQIEAMPTLYYLALCVRELGDKNQSVKYLTKIMEMPPYPGNLRQLVGYKLSEILIEELKAKKSESERKLFAKNWVIPSLEKAQKLNTQGELFLLIANMIFDLKIEYELIETPKGHKARNHGHGATP